ncbi:hypothetical protein SD71_05715 [Cohnella kolymensis]|uniref:Uncharacterized protein n=1 Tax=Cohnella kolymensis TaxID=1590652 RepID=A0ABR5A6V3_9BACL|nr:hypothetical protein [Cohnella kolymensis]KIL36752.1 hypothetical protein SD71_05715 [Cohnella kolymensis]
MKRLNTTGGQTSSESSSLENRFNAYIISKQLIRLSVNKGRGIKLNIPCRLLNYDADLELLSVYHVDEKQVYTFNLTEIDDLVE